MFKRLFIITSLVFGLTACGFHLRGSLDNLSSTSLVGERVYITSLSDEEALEVQVKHLLNLSRVNVEKLPEDADYQIVIVKSSLDRFASGLDTNGRINEYEFIMQFDFVVVESRKVERELNQKNQAIHPSIENELQKSLKVSRHFYFETNDLIGKKNEENTLLKDMKGQLAIQFLQQFSAFINNNKNNNHSSSKLRMKEGLDG